ncbi:MAG: hypothetical protein ACOC5T_00235 [Elusimicrobiota bacterium]
MEKNIILSSIFLLINVLNIHAGIVDFGEKIEITSRYNIGAGYNLPFKGYENYENNPVFHSKIDILREKDFERQQMNYRIGVGYFMMMLPPETSGVTDDMFEVSAEIINLLTSKSNPKLIPYLGLGMGLYLDWVRINTPAINSYNIYRFFGLNSSLGCEIPITKSFFIIPEITGHLIFVSGFSTSTNLSFCLNFAPGSKPSGYRRKK